MRKSVLMSMITAGLLGLAYQKSFAFDINGIYRGSFQCDQVSFEGQPVPIVSLPNHELKITKTDTGFLLETFGVQYDGACTNFSPGFIGGDTCVFVARSCEQILGNYCEIITAKIGTFLGSPVGTEPQDSFLATSHFSDATGERPGFASCTYDFRRVGNGP